ncbi:MAG: hypothetical protein ACP5QO_09350 [Clostridia bacterium]
MHDADVEEAHGKTVAAQAGDELVVDGAFVAHVGSGPEEAAHERLTHLIAVTHQGDHTQAD